MGGFFSKMAESSDEIIFNGEKFETLIIFSSFEQCKDKLTSAKNNNNNLFEELDVSSNVCTLLKRGASEEKNLPVIKNAIQCALLSPNPKKNLKQLLNIEPDAPSLMALAVCYECYFIPVIVDGIETLENEDDRNEVYVEAFKYNKKPYADRCIHMDMYREITCKNVAQYKLLLEVIDRLGDKLKFEGEDCAGYQVDGLGFASAFMEYHKTYEGPEMQRKLWNKLISESDFLQREENISIRFN